MLRAKRFAGYKFKRQQAIGSYIVDFVSFSAGLIVEADGSQHAESHYDATRDAWLKSQNFRILRLWNNDVLAKRDQVADAIWAALQQPPLPNPSPTRGEGLSSHSHP